MKKLYEDPEVEVFYLEVRDVIMDCSSEICGLHTGGCELECVMEGQCYLEASAM